MNRILPASLGLSVAALALALLPLAPAQAQTQLLTNGGFETGTFAGWTTVTQADTRQGTDAAFFVDNNNNSDGYSPDDPSTGYPFYTPGSPVTDLPTAGSHNGSFYAVTDSDRAANNALFQSFTVPVNATQVTLSFALFVNARDGQGALNTGGTLDYTQTAKTQFARVDLLSATALPFSTSSGDVLRNFYTNVDPGGKDPNGNANALAPTPWKTYSFDITNSVARGQTYQIRFADVSNRFYFNTGVDDVSVSAIGPSAGAPEPASAVFLLLGGAAWGVKRRKRT